MWRAEARAEVRDSAPESWVVRVDHSQLLHVPLYVRDAIGMEVPVSGWTPPRLRGDVVPRTQYLDDRTRDQMREQWQEWWSEAIQHELGMTELVHGRQPGGGPLPRPAERSELLAHWREAGEPRGELLTRPARELRDEALAWFNEQQRARIEAARTQGRPPLRFGSPFMSWIDPIARDVAQARDVPLGRVHADVQVLFVEGPWWSLSPHGPLLCSEAAAADEDLIAPALRSAFERGL